MKLAMSILSGCMKKKESNDRSEKQTTVIAQFPNGCMTKKNQQQPENQQ